MLLKVLSTNNSKIYKFNSKKFREPIEEKRKRLGELLAIKEKTQKDILKGVKLAAEIELMKRDLDYKIKFNPEKENLSDKLWNEILGFEIKTQDPLEKIDKLLDFLKEFAERIKKGLIKANKKELLKNFKKRIRQLEILRKSLPIKGEFRRDFFALKGESEQFRKRYYKYLNYPQFIRNY